MPVFPTTRWSIFANRDTERDRQEIWDYLARIYWKPLHVVAMGRRMNVDDANDAVQSFFHSILEKDSFIDRPQEGEGSLRSYLRGSFLKFLVSQYRKDSAKKRGGGIEHSELDEERPDSQTLQPGEAYDLAYAHSVYSEAIRSTSEHYSSRPHYFKILVAVCHDEIEKADAWKKLDCTSEAGAMALKRFRIRLYQKMESIIRAGIDPVLTGLVQEELEMLNKFPGSKLEK